jgi:ABC-type branched-subunit amino acid transport system substrate-binding protein
MNRSHFSARTGPTLAVVVVAAAFLLAACGSNSNKGAGSQAGSDGPIAIGIPAGLSSPLAPVAKATIVGIQYAIKQQNAAGGINGRKIVPYIIDDAGTPQGSISAYLKLVTADHIAAIVGMASGEELTPMINTAQSRHDFVPIVGLAGPESIAKPGSVPYNWVYGTYINQNTTAASQVDNLYKFGKVRKFGIMYTNDAYGTLNYDIASAEIHRLGASLVSTQQLEEGVSNLVSPLTALKNAGAQGVLLYNPVAPATELAFFNARATLDYYVPTAMYDDDFGAAGITSTNPLARNVYSNTVCDTQTAGFQKFLGAISGQLGTGESPQFAAADYVGAQVLFHAMMKAKDPANPADVNQALQTQVSNFQSICGSGTVTLSARQHSFNLIVPMYITSGGQADYLVK